MYNKSPHNWQATFKQRSNISFFLEMSLNKTKQQQQQKRYEKNGEIQRIHGEQSQASFTLTGPGSTSTIQQHNRQQVG